MFIYARVYIYKKKKNVSVTIPISFLYFTPLDESNVKNGARVVTMCNAMQRNENHFGRVTFWPCVRALPPPPPHQHRTVPYPPPNGTRHAITGSASPPRNDRVRFTAWPIPTHRDDVTKPVPPPSVASGTRRLHRSVGVLKHGRLRRTGEGH